MVLCSAFEGLLCPRHWVPLQRFSLPPLAWLPYPLHSCAVLAWANKISRTQPENVLLRPTPHVTASGDVVMGLPLDPVVSAKVVDIVESVGDKTQWGNQRTAASRGQLLTYLRQNVTDQFLRDAIVRRAHAYWLYLDADSAPVPTLRVGA